MVQTPLQQDSKYKINLDLSKENFDNLGELKRLKLYKENFQHLALVKELEISQIVKGSQQWHRYIFIFIFTNHAIPSSMQNCGK